MRVATTTENRQSMHFRKLQVLTMEFLEELKRLGIANELIIEAWKNFSGNGIYICKFKEISTSERNRRIKAEFTGDNRRELSIKYDLSYSRLCRILNDGQVKKVARASNDRRQIVTRKSLVKAGARFGFS